MLNKILFLATLLLGMAVCADAWLWPDWFSILLICFSGRTTVQVKGKAGATRMDQLKIGDHVLTKDGKTYSKVYSFSHYLPQAQVEFVQIRTATEGDAPLEISADHMLFVNDAVQPAKYVRVGDTVIGKDGAMVPVIAVDHVVQAGAYGPLTETGTIQVNGVAASNYIALDVLEPLLSHRVQNWIYHKAMAPHRIMCTAFGNSCENETYNEAGFNHRVARMLPLIGWTEWLVQNWLQMLMGIVVGFLFWKKRSSSQQVIKKRAHVEPAAKLKF